MARERKNERHGKFIVGGYTFASENEAQAARDEMSAIKYLSIKTDLNDAKQVYVLYNSIIDRELFKTQVGLDYLKKLQLFLYSSSEIPNERIKAIPISSDLKMYMEEKREYTKAKGTIVSLKKRNEQFRDYFIKMLILNIILVIVIIIMFIIMNSSSRPTIINYENKIQDKYSSWQEQLQSEEASLKERENNLNKK